MNLIKKLVLQIGILLSSSVFLFAEFTIGLYGVKTSSDVISAKEAGFNCVQSYISEPATINILAEEALKNDIKLVVYPTKIMSSKYKDIATKYPIKAWYLFDEPDVWNCSREKLLTLEKDTKKMYPNIQTTFVIGEGFTKVPYYDISDILMVDWYPVPHLPLESFGENIALARQGLVMVGKEKKELWAVVQLFDWKEYKQYRMDDDRIGRFPKKEEIRFMTYDAIFNGATGLFYFTYYSNGKPLPEAKPKEWAKIIEVIQEISFVGEIIENGKEIENPIEIREPLKARSFEYGGIKYTFVINPTSKKQTLPSLFFQAQFDVIYEKSTNLRKIMSKSKNNLQPYRVLAFRYE